MKVHSGLPRPSVTGPTVAEATRERILAGAVRAFGSGGYRGTSVPAIATEAGVSVGLIYRYYPSKEHLFVAMCESELQRGLDELTTELATIDEPRDRLARAIGAYVAGVSGDWGAMLVHAWAEAELDDRLREALQARCTALRGFATGYVSEAIARGEVSADLDAARLGLASALLLDGIVAHAAEQGDRFDAPAVESAVLALLSSALRPTGPR